MDAMEELERVARGTMQQLVADLIQAGTMSERAVTAIDQVINMPGDYVQRVIRDAVLPQADALASSRRGLLVFASALWRLEKAARAAGH